MGRYVRRLAANRDSVTFVGCQDNQLACQKIHCVGVAGPECRYVREAAANRAALEQVRRERMAERWQLTRFASPARRTAAVTAR